MRHRIKQISITDTYGCAGTTVFNPGSICVITGQNGSGKSSILKALCYIFEGGMDPSVIRRGAEKSVVSFTLEDGTQITKTTAPVKQRRGQDGPVKYRADLEILDPHGQPIAAPMSFIKELSESFAVDPAQILRIDASTVPGKKALYEILLKLAPVRFAPDEVSEALKYRTSVEIPMQEPDALAMPDFPSTFLDLDGLRKVHGYVTEFRRRVGITKEESDGAISRLERGILPGAVSDPSAELAQAEEAKAAILQAINDRKAEVERETAAAREQASKALAAARAAADQAYMAALVIAEKAKAEALEAARAEYSRANAAIQEVVDAELKALQDQAGPDLDAATAEVATLKQNRDAFIQARTIREQIAKEQVVCKQHIFKYDQLTDVLRRLEALRVAKLQDLPVPGLVVEDGEVLIDGIPWHNVNLSRRVDVAIALCCQNAGSLQLVQLDDSEHLDTEMRAAVDEGLKRAGWQVIRAQVSDGPLTIEVLA